MQFNRPIVMSIAGHDPCGGAGLLADIKAFEQNKVYGLGVTTAQPCKQKIIYLHSMESEENILKAIEQMLSHYNIKAVKIGIVQSIETLYKIICVIDDFDTAINIVIDPVIRSTTEFNFWKEEVDEHLLYNVLRRITLITPNYKEVVQLVPAADAKDAAEKISHYCSVLLKGGHNEEEQGVDYLYYNGKVAKLSPGEVTIYPKHGSGCVLSSAITANIALGYGLEEACSKAKLYTEKF